MHEKDGILIRVQGEWNGWRRAQVRLGDLRDVHWFQPDLAPRPLVYGHISCTNIVDGDIPHDCSLTPGPHRLLVCVLKRHTAPCAHAELAQRADEHAGTERTRSADQLAESSEGPETRSLAGRPSLLFGAGGLLFGAVAGAVAWSVRNARTPGRFGSRA
jgi:hypothetical protein